LKGTNSSLNIGWPNKNLLVKPSRALYRIVNHAQIIGCPYHSSSPSSKICLRCSLIVLLPFSNSLAISFCVSHSVSSLKNTSILTLPSSVLKMTKLGNRCYPLPSINYSISGICVRFHLSMVKILFPACSMRLFILFI
jgi:hypothetical protein